MNCDGRDCSACKETFVYETRWEADHCLDVSVMRGTLDIILLTSEFNEYHPGKYVIEMKEIL